MRINLCCCGNPVCDGCLLDWQVEILEPSGVSSNFRCFPLRTQIDLPLYTHAPALVTCSWSNTIALGYSQYTDIFGTVHRDPIENIVAVGLDSWRTTPPTPPSTSGVFTDAYFGRTNAGTPIGIDFDYTVTQPNLPTCASGDYNYEFTSEDYITTYSLFPPTPTCSGIFNITAVSKFEWACPSSLPDYIILDVAGVFGQRNPGDCGPELPPATPPPYTWHLCQDVPSGQVLLERAYLHTTNTSQNVYQWYRASPSSPTDNFSFALQLLHTGWKLWAFRGTAELHVFTNYSIGDGCSMGSFGFTHEESYGYFYWPGGTVGHQRIEPSSCCYVVGTPTIMFSG